jgi:DNA processing protein
MGLNLLHELALSMVDQIGSVNFKTLIAYCGSAEEVFKAKKSKLFKIPGINEQISSNIHQQQNSLLQEAEKQIMELEKIKAVTHYYLEDNYPKRLKNFQDAPPILFYKGNADVNNQKVIAVVGTRTATNYGKDFLNQLIPDLVKYNPLIVSGLAYGIDIHAHKLCLQHRLETIGVMATGLDGIYPALHRKTAMEMLELGGLLTENPLKTKPDAFRFPARNRIIAGMSDAVLVIEARHKGGALITAEIANNYNVDVLALPGNYYQKTSIGCNNLIKSNKANLFDSIKDIEYLLNWDQSKPDKKAKQTDLFYDESEISDEDKVLLDYLKGKTNIYLEQLYLELNIPVSQINASILNLELMGILKVLPGKEIRLYE